MVSFPPPNRSAIMTRPFRLLALSFSLMTLAGSAAAQTVSDTQSALAYFNRLDQQKKGSFTLADMQRIEGKEFKRIDADHDGKLSLEEYLYGIPADRPDVLRRYTRKFELSDRNHDGFVSYDEYMQFCARVVELADTNKDGIVTKEEFMAIASTGDQ
jgi:hypothetical protein